MRLISHTFFINIPKYHHPNQYLEVHRIETSLTLYLDCAFSKQTFYFCELKSKQGLTSRCI